MNKRKTLRVETLIHAAEALAEARVHNQTAKGSSRIDEDALTRRLMHLYLGPECPKEPRQLDPFSVMYGGILIHAGNIITQRGDNIELGGRGD